MKAELGARIFRRSVLVLLGVLFFVVALEVWLFSSKEVEVSREDLIRRLDGLEPNIIQALWRVDPEPIKVALNSLSANPGVARVTMRAQFRINDIDESYVRQGIGDIACSEEIVRNYSHASYNGLEIGSGVLTVCFSEDLINAKNWLEPILGGVIKNVVIASVVALFIFLLINRSIIAPVHQIITRLQQGDLLSDEALKRDTWDRNDEIDALYEQLIEKEVIAQRAHENEKLRILGIMASGIAHDFNNLLGVIMANAELMREQCDDPQGFESSIGTLMRAVNAGSAMTARLTHLHEKKDEALILVGIPEIWDSLQSFIPLLVPKRITVEYRLESNSKILVETGGLESALLNLVLNARDALTNVEAGRIILHASNLADESSDIVRLCVEDNGIGIHPEHLDQAASPFFTTKTNTGGSGLGLTMAKEFAERSGGSIEITSRPRIGTKVCLCLPAIDNSAPNAEEAAPCDIDSTSSAHSGIAVLIIEDEENLAYALAKHLKFRGYRCEVMNHPRALIKQPQYAKQFDILVCDISLGPIQGPELYEMIQAALLEQSPPVLFISGAASKSQRRSLPERHRNNLLIKPFEVRLLDQRIRAIIQKEGTQDRCYQRE